jgi:hypothetical protein
MEVLVEVGAFIELVVFWLLFPGLALLLSVLVVLWALNMPVTPL